MKLKTPLRIKETGGYVDVVDADDNPISFLTDIELGWTDTSTGNYVDPDEEYAVLDEIVRRVNACDHYKENKHIP